MLSLRHAAWPKSLTGPVAGPLAVVAGMTAAVTIAWWLIGQAPLTRHNRYIWLHGLLDTCAIVVSALVFFQARKHHRGHASRSSVIIGSAYLGVALLVFQHAFSSPATWAPITAASASKAISFWLAANLMAGAALVYVAWSDCNRSVPVPRIHVWAMGSLALAGLISWIILSEEHSLPGMQMLDKGLTPPNAALAFVVIALCIAAAVGFYRQPVMIEGLPSANWPYDSRALMAAAVITALTGVGMTQAAGANGFFYLLGHAYKIIAAWFVYRGLAAYLPTFPATPENAANDADGRLARSNERLEAELLQRTRQLEAMYDAAVNAILTIDPKGAIQTINAATTRLLGYSKDELIGRNVNMLMPEPYARQHDGYLASYLSTGQKKIIGIGREVTARRKDGTTFPIHLSVSEFDVSGKRYFTGIITDLSERQAAELALRDTERKLAQAQKMEAVGQLTGGLAHDFNNLLTVITGNLELLDMRVDGAEERDLIRRADEAARMGARLTGRLLTFSRRRTLQPTVLNLSEAAVGMTELLRRTLGEAVSVHSQLAPDLWSTRVDASEIENAILNLAINARDAMPNGGRILIETANVELSQDDLAHAPGSHPGAYVKLSVSDTGIGMPPDVVARAFEPFFTTKGPGRGTGLGLSTIFGFVKQSGGHATIYSEVGQGTLVSLYLPRDAGSIVQAERTHRAIETRAKVGETVLVVEDNEQVRLVTVKRLDALGYKVFVAGDGPAAIALLEQNGDIDLVFSDVVMPGGISGFDIHSWVSRHRPGIRVLLTSGFAPEMASKDAAIDPAVILLRKPFTQVELAQAIREAFGK